MKRRISNARKKRKRQRFIRKKPVLWQPHRRIDSFTYNQLELYKTSPLYIESRPSTAPEIPIVNEPRDYMEPIARSIHSLSEEKTAKDWDKEFKRAAADRINLAAQRGEDIKSVLRNIYQKGIL